MSTINKKCWEHYQCPTYVCDGYCIVYGVHWSLYLWSALKFQGDSLLSIFPQSISLTMTALGLRGFFDHHILYFHFHFLWSFTHIVVVAFSIKNMNWSFIESKCEIYKVWLHEALVVTWQGAITWHVQPISRVPKIIWYLVLGFGLGRSTSEARLSYK